MQKRRKYLRKWKARISVYDVSSQHHRRKTNDADQIFYGVLDEWINAYAEQLLFKKLNASIYNIDWKCIMCKTPLTINIKRLVKLGKQIDRRAFYCDTCRPKKFTIDIAASPILYRYMSAFYSKIRNIIKTNTNTSELL